MAKISVLGLGAMGSRMAKSLLTSGHQVTVWNRILERALTLSDKGATVARSPREAVTDADVVISMVRNDEASRAVWLDPDIGALAGMAVGAIAIESSTLSIEWIRQLSTIMEQHGRDFLDAPVMGSRPQADARQLIYFVGGNAQVIERCMPVFQSIGIAVHHSGPIGSGAVIKLAVNALFGIQVAAFAELIGLLKSSGVDVTKAIDIISTTPVCSVAAKGAAASMLAANFAPLFPIELIDKDLRYTQEAAANYSACLPLTDVTKNVMTRAISKGLGADHLTSIVQLYVTPDR